MRLGKSLPKVRQKCVSELKGVNKIDGDMNDMKNFEDLTFVKWRIKIVCNKMQLIYIDKFIN